MKNLFPRMITVAFSLLLIVSCNNKKDKTTENPSGDTATAKQDIVTTQQPVQAEPSATTNANQQDYSFEPTVSVITGTITSEMFYGPPGYGEHPETDKKEYPYLVTLEKPINVIAPATKASEDAGHETVNNISKIQLIWPDNMDMAKLKDKKVKLTGTFFSAHTGHHRTDVLMDVKKIDEL